MIEGNELITYKYDGFWVSMDTFKDKQLLDDMYHKGDTPWEVWKENDTQKITICNGKLKEVSL
jgi:glucose-1-phosphate cytidylyltransferase